MSDIIDRIDALVDEQLAGGEPENGFDFNDPDYPRCPHCDRNWHGLPITNKIATMYSWRQFDPEYSYADDDSGVVCEGSDFIGPRRPDRQESWRCGKASISITLSPADRDSFSVYMARFQRHLDGIASAILGLNTPTFEVFRATSWTITQPSYGNPRRGLPNDRLVIFDEAWNPVAEIVCPGPLPEVDIKFGPENWHLDFQHPRSHQLLPSAYQRQDPASRAVRYHWNALTAADFPVPESPGYDFSGYNDAPSHARFTNPRENRHQQRRRV